MVAPIRVLQEGAARIGAGDARPAASSCAPATRSRPSATCSIADGQPRGVLRRASSRRWRRARASWPTPTATSPRRSSSRRRRARSCASSASSPTDIQPVLDALVQSATRLCGAYDAVIFLRDGGQLLRRGRPPRRRFPNPIEGVRRAAGARNGCGTRAARAAGHHVVDLQDEAAGVSRRHASAPRQLGHRTTLSVPLVREGARDRRDRSSAAPRRTLLRQADRPAPDLRRPGGHRHRERAPVQRAAGADAGADTLGGRAPGARRGGAGGQLQPGHPVRPHQHRLARGRALADRRRHHLRVRRGHAGVRATGELRHRPRN